MDITQNLDQAVNEIRDLTDPLERCRRTHNLITLLDETTKTLATIRRSDVTTLTGTGGMTDNQLAAELNVTPRRIGQLRASRPDPARVLITGGKDNAITVAIPQKADVEARRLGRVVSTGATQAWERMRDLTDDLGVTSTLTIVRPGDDIDFNTPGFVLIAGPRHSPLIRQIAAADTKLGFTHEEEQGWRLVDRVTGTVYQSPEDHGESGDIAYVGRLPRPDQNGSFLYIGSLHAMGAAGAVHFLQGNLPDLFRETRTKRFSFLVRCTYDPHTQQVATSERITPIYTADK